MIDIKANKIINDACNDLEDLFNSIKKSTRFHEYQDKGTALSNIYFAILSSFVLNQLLELGAGAKMIHKESGMAVPKLKRLELVLNAFGEKYNYAVNELVKVIGNEK